MYLWPDVVLRVIFFYMKLFCSVCIVYSFRSRVTSPPPPPTSHHSLVDRHHVDFVFVDLVLVSNEYTFVLSRYKVYCLLEQLPVSVGCVRAGRHILKELYIFILYCVRLELCCNRDHSYVVPDSFAPLRTSSLPSLYGSLYVTMYSSQRSYFT